MFEHRIRYSNRAKHVSLRINSEQGLEVVLPRGVSTDCIADLLERKQSWIRRHLKKLDSRPAHTEPLSIPSQLDFQAVGECVKIEIKQSGTNGEFWLLPDHNGVLCIEGDVSNATFVIEDLINWLKKAAHHRLLPMLERLSQQHQLPFSRLSVRDQKTRWGSCSTLGNINLNFRLLFMPPELCEHVMLHELTHTVHMNHSPEFWRLLESMDPKTQQHKAALKNVRDILPAWMGGNQ